jgi:hypothetical protein
MSDNNLNEKVIIDLGDKILYLSCKRCYNIYKRDDYPKKRAVCVECLKDERQKYYNDKYKDILKNKYVKSNGKRGRKPKNTNINPENNE